MTFYEHIILTEIFKKILEMNFSLNKFIEAPTPGCSNCLYVDSTLKTANPLTFICCCVLNKLELPQQFEWTTDDVLNWINALGFPEYKDSFRVNFIDGKKLIRIDTSALIKMNIKNFNHIKLITKSIRKMYGIEIENSKRSISLPFSEPLDLYKLHKSYSGYSYEVITCCDFFKKVTLLKDVPEKLNHFELLHNWFKHIPDFQNTRIGNIKTKNVCHVKRNLEPVDNISFESVESCFCEMPPCNCKWTVEELNNSLNFTLLLDK
ncbi:unnamed protein product [Chironomus riparius]|uniref:SAM domain-containing protein n=1 Tax=Chironomus riparius TaxID=315576 RepID=A0A9N9RSB8_9DIPT|nr:unnamed protein product [Chironomus riparius]